MPVDASDGIAIVYPSNWPRDDTPDPHCTIIYLGKVSKVDFTKADVEAALGHVSLEAPGAVRTKGLEMFGPDKDIPVVTLDPGSQVLVLQRIVVEGILGVYGIENASEFKDYKPHVTITNKDIEIPESVTLGEPVLWWARH
jgi:2'-5' RNA ligase